MFAKGSAAAKRLQPSVGFLPGSRACAFVQEKEIVLWLPTTIMLDFINRAVPSLYDETIGLVLQHAPEVVEEYKSVLRTHGSLAEIGESGKEPISGAGAGDA
jgi:hypothetical protein